MHTIKRILPLALLATGLTQSEGQIVPPPSDTTGSGSAIGMAGLGLDRTEATGTKSPWFAFAASAAIPGLGQFYGERPVTGSLFLGIEAAMVGTYFFLKSEGDSKETDFMLYARDNAGAAAEPPDATHDFDKYFEDLIKEGTTWSGDYSGDDYLRFIEGNDGFDEITYTGDATHFFDWVPIPGDSELAQEADFLDFYTDFDDRVLSKILATDQNGSYNQKAWKDAAKTNLAPDRDFTGELSDFFDSSAPIASNGNVQRTYDEYRVRAYGGEWHWDWDEGEGTAAQNLAQYKKLRAKANDTYKQATFVGGLALFNHVVSAIHAAKGSVLKNKERHASLPGGAEIGLGVNPSVKNPGVELRLTRAF